jgi:hypothetical protein
MIDLIKRSDWLVTAIIIPWVIVSRLPAILCSEELNVDESLFAACGMRYSISYIPWYSFDSGSSGPLNTLPFYLASLVFGNLNYHHIHFLASLVVILVVYATWRTLRLITAKRIAVLSTFNTLAFIALAQDPDFVHFSSELIPIALFSFATYFFVMSANSKHGQSLIWVCLAMVLAGAAPWAKLQSSPISLLFYCYGAICIGQERDGALQQSKRITRSFLLLSFSFLLPSISLALIILLGGGWQDFWKSYIQSNLLYAQGTGISSLFSRFIYLFFDIRTGRLPLLIAVSSFFFFWIFSGRPGWRTSSRSQQVFLAFIVTYLAVAIFAVLKPPYNFFHYQWFLLHPSFICCALILDSFSRTQMPLENVGYRSAMPSVESWFVLFFIGLYLTVLMNGLRGVKAVLALKPDPFVETVALKIGEYRGDGMQLGIWGWSPSLYLQTGLIPASRHLVTYYAIEPSPNRDYFRSKLLDDLRSCMPKVFVDTIAPGFFKWKWSEADRLDGFGELNRFIFDNYKLAEELSRSDGLDPVRIYVLKGVDSEYR